MSFSTAANRSTVRRSAAPPRVSIIIPAYNSERYIRTALDSVLSQTYSDYEVIVVDDGSTDGTRAAVLAVGGPVRCLSQQNGGPSAARNTGLVAARGEFICFLDADDSWTPDKLDAQVSFMDRNARIGLVFSDEDEFDDQGVQCASLLATSRFHREIVSGEAIVQPFQKLLAENFIPTSTVMVRKRCFETAGLFDVNLRGPEDRDMWSRIAASFEIACIPLRLGRKRIVPSSVSRDSEATLRSRIRLWSKARQLFPDLASGRTVNALLAPTYLELGFVQLRKGQRGEARKAGLRSLWRSRRPSQWALATGLVLLSFSNTLAHFALAPRRSAGSENQARRHEAA
jgi:glycosyltransferase involved in cell wall biosynthesis